MKDHGIDSPREFSAGGSFLANIRNASARRIRLVILLVAFAMILIAFSAPAGILGPGEGAVQPLAWIPRGQVQLHADQGQCAARCTSPALLERRGAVRMPLGWDNPTSGMILTPCIWNVSTEDELTQRWPKCRTRFLETLSSGESEAPPTICVDFRAQFNGKGLANQLLQLTRNVMAGLLGGMTSIVIPQARSRKRTTFEKTDFDDKTSGMWADVPPSAVYDMETFTTFLRNVGVNIVDACPEGSQVVKFGKATATPLVGFEASLKSAITKLKFRRGQGRSVVLRNPGTVIANDKVLRATINTDVYHTNHELHWPNSLTMVMQDIIRPAAFAPTAGAELRQLANDVRGDCEGVFHFRAESDARLWWNTSAVEQLQYFQKIRNHAFPFVKCWYIASGLFNVPPENSGLPVAEAKFVYRELNAMRSRGEVTFAEFGSPLRKKLLDKPLEAVASFDLYLSFGACAFIGFGKSSFDIVAATYRVNHDGNICSVMTPPVEPASHRHWLTKFFPPELAHNIHLVQGTSAVASEGPEALADAAQDRQ